MTILASISILLPSLSIRPTSLYQVHPGSPKVGFRKTLDKVEFVVYYLNYWTYIQILRLSDNGGLLYVLLD